MSGMAVAQALRKRWAAQAAGAPTPAHA